MNIIVPATTSPNEQVYSINHVVGQVRGKKIVGACQVMRAMIPDVACERVYGDFILETSISRRWFDKRNSRDKSGGDHSVQH